MNKIANVEKKEHKLKSQAIKLHWVRNHVCLCAEHLIPCHDYNNYSVYICRINE